MTVAIVTAIYDGYDELRELPAQTINVDAVCVTDNPDLTSCTWRIVYEPRPGVHPNRAAKPPKMCPWRYTDCDQSIWVDALFQVVAPGFAKEAISHVSRRQPIAQFDHPGRQCIYTEAQASMQIPKYSAEPILEQADSYRTEGHPASWGLWEAGVTVRQHTGPAVEMGEMWLAEVDHWSFQDQISLPVVLRRLGLRSTCLPRHRPWLKPLPSIRHQTG